MRQPPKLKSPLSLFLALCSCILPTLSQAIPLSTSPFNIATNNRPLAMILLDNSGSMDWEVSFPTYEGLLWWDTYNTKRAIKPDGSFVFAEGVYKAYLFPMQNCGTASNTSCGSNGYLGVIPPTPQFAFARSSAYNPLFYNPLVSYSPWPSAFINGSLVSFSNADPLATKSHPLSNPLTLQESYNLTAPVSLPSSSVGTVWMEAGMLVPAGTPLRDGSSWTPAPSSFIVPDGQRIEAYFPTFFPTFWHPASCTPNNSDCVSHVDGKTLKKYEIKPSTPSYPSGRSYADELQNFANWFQYYRKRKLATASYSAPPLASFPGLYLKGLPFIQMPNTSDTPTVSTDNASPASNAQRINGWLMSIETNTNHTGTPTRETLKRAGDLLSSDTSLIATSCQRNAALIMTDGYSEVTPVPPPAYPNTYTSSPSNPYASFFQNIHPGSLADIAASYYTNNPRPDLPTGQVATSQTASIYADKNPNLHLNTYSLIIGSSGTLFPSTYSDPYAQVVNWTNPYTKNGDTIDDAVHATLTGRGKHFFASNPSSISSALSSILSDATKPLLSGSAISISSPNLTASSSAFAASYDTSFWTGNLFSYPINPSTGQLPTSNPSSGQSASWNAASSLASKNWSSRIFASFNGSSGAPWTPAAIGHILNPANSIHPNTLQLMNWIQGDSSLESISFKKRHSPLAPTGWHAQPALTQSSSYVYVPSASGILHAFSKSTGEEAWAYVPGFAAPLAAASALPSSPNSFILDSSPLIVSLSDNSRILVSGGSLSSTGFFALDITSEAAQSSEDLAKKVLWEFPNASTPSTTKNLIGQSFYPPTYMKSPSMGDVIAIPGGYNSSSSHQATLFILNAKTGQLLKTIQASGPNPGPSGISQLTAPVSPSNFSTIAYAGDINGNLYRFDIEAGSAQHIASLTDPIGTPQPITTPPDTTQYLGKTLITVGTGRLNHPFDTKSSITQAIYAFFDPTELSPFAPISTSSLTKITTTGSTAINPASQAPYSWSTSSPSNKGWFITLPPGHHISSQPKIAGGAVNVNSTLIPTGSSCLSGSTSFAINILNPASYSPLPDPYASSMGVSLSGTLSAPTLVRTASGTIRAISQSRDNPLVNRTIAQSPGSSLSITAKKRPIH